MGLSEYFGFSSSDSNSDSIPEIYAFDQNEATFVLDDVNYIFSRILIDVFERVEGVPEEQRNLFWDSCLVSEKPDGLVTLLSKAMTDQGKLYIVYRKDLKLIREANQEEKKQIEADYKAKGESKAGVYISFENFNRSKFMKIYSSLEYTAICALYKNLNLSKAIQIKVDQLRASVGLTDKTKAENQGSEIADALSEGKDVLLDSKDLIEMLKIDIAPTEAAMEFINKKRSFYLGLPASWITGLQTTGLSDTGKADSKAVDRGLRAYYYSIVKPVVEALLGVTKLTFKADDFEEIISANETLKAFEVTNEQFLSAENKNLIINKLYKLPHDSKGDVVKEEVELPVVKVPFPPKGV
jgi:hypothetical protein